MGNVIFAETSFIVCALSDSEKAKAEDKFYQCKQE